MQVGRRENFPERLVRALGTEGVLNDGRAMVPSPDRRPSLLVRTDRARICLTGLLSIAAWLCPPAGHAIAGGNDSVDQDFRMLDTNHNGSLSWREFHASGMDARVFNEADADKDKQLSFNEFGKAIAIEQRLRSGQYFDDAWITAKVKAMLLENRMLGGPGIQVKTENGVVHLSGKLSSLDQIHRVLAIASGIKGVKSIHNSLQLGDGPRMDNTDGAHDHGHHGSTGVAHAKAEDRQPTVRSYKEEHHEIFSPDSRVTGAWPGGMRTETTGHEPTQPRLRYDGAGITSRFFRGGPGDNTVPTCANVHRTFGG
jgi:hyperosmotically inducible protein